MVGAGRFLATGSAGTGLALLGCSTVVGLGVKTALLVTTGGAILAGATTGMTTLRAAGMTATGDGALLGIAFGAVRALSRASLAALSFRIASLNALSATVGVVRFGANTEGAALEAEECCGLAIITAGFLCSLTIHSGAAWI